ncbi:MAG: acyl-CoA/acyl-ACP dehydrogenase [Hyphomicrobiales bacterium]|nr:acyl-CoA/acyl-ACP dehydrogenase [Hyphomicrobiales bacterium]
MDFQTLEKNIDALVSAWMPQRAERMARQALDRADFEALAGAGMTLVAIPAAFGGLWEPAERPAVKIAALLRKLATVDPSLALVAAMHPTVLLNWIEDAPGGPPGWQEQRMDVFENVRKGAWFGTISSEPGIGGDFLATRATATHDAASGCWLMSGDKYMGSGSGVTSFMMTTARPAGEELPEVFLLDCRDLPWDGSKGLELVREWDGAGMGATQSHAFRFDKVAVTRHGLLGGAVQRLPQNASTVGYLFSSVFMGLLDAAGTEARRIVASRSRGSSGFEQMHFVKALNLIWLANQAFNGMAQALERADPALDILHGKLAIADLAEGAMVELAHALGGGSLSRSSPFAQWHQDVRALGHLRPPRPLTYEKLFDAMTEAHSGLP